MDRIVWITGGENVTNSSVNLETRPWKQNISTKQTQNNRKVASNAAVEFGNKTETTRSTKATDKKKIRTRRQLFPGNFKLNCWVQRKLRELSHLLGVSHLNFRRSERPSLARFLNRVKPPYHLCRLGHAHLVTLLYATLKKQLISKSISWYSFSSSPQSIILKKLNILLVE